MRISGNRRVNHSRRGAPTAAFERLIERHATLLALGLAAGLTGCALPTQQMVPDEEPVVTGSAARRNYTPLEPAFVCLANGIREKRQPPISVAVGDVKDYTGKYSQNEGNAITQGGTLMIYSALGKMGDVVRMHERFDTRIAELELAYADRRQLGDGRSHVVEPGKTAVPWVPYFGGSILRSQYYIVGGITEVNYNIQSGGVDASVSLIGARRRTFTMSVGVDLRIVDTRTLIVVKTVSMQKQIKGQEVGAGVYRFFNSELFDISVGAKNQEPLQLAVRTAMEHGVLELMAAVSGVDADDCISRALDSRLGDAELPPPTAEGEARMAAYGEQPIGSQPAPARATVATAAPVSAAPAAPAAPAQASAQNGQASQSEPTARPAVVFQIQFDFATSALSSRVLAQIEQTALAASKGNGMVLVLAGRDSEIFPPMQRSELTRKRIEAVTSALGTQGIAATSVSVAWMPRITNAGIVRLGSGFQQLAVLQIAR